MPANLASLRDEARQLRETANYFSVHSDGTDATTTKIRSLNDRSADMLKRFLEKNSGRLSVEEEKSLKDDIAEGFHNNALHLLQRFNIMKGVQDESAAVASLGVIVDLTGALYWREDYASAYFQRGNVQKMRGNQVEFIKDWLRAFVLPLHCWADPAMIRSVRKEILSGSHNAIKPYSVRGQWKKVSTDGVRGVHPACAFPCVGVDDNDIVYLFGGEASDGETDLISLEYLSAFSRFDMKREQWLPPVKKHSPWPPARSKGSIAYRNGSVYLWGGCAPGQRLGNTVWRFDIATERWEKHRTQGASPEERYSHGDATINGYLYVFGGRLKIDPPEVDRLQDRLERSPAPVSPEMMRPLNLLRCRNDLWRLDLEQLKWERVLKNTKACPPAPPAMMEMACWADGDSLLFFGGHLREDTREARSKTGTIPLIRAFNTTTKEWSTAQRRASINAVPALELECSAHRGFMFGGYWDGQSTPLVRDKGQVNLLSSTYYQDLLFFADGALKLVTCTNSPPSQRAGAAVFANNKRDKCFVLNGYNTFTSSGPQPFGDVNSFGDMYCCKMKKKGSVLNLMPCSFCDVPPPDAQHPHSACARCKQARYCSRDCQKSHWKDHKRVCQQAKKE